MHEKFSSECWIFNTNAISADFASQIAIQTSGSLLNSEYRNSISARKITEVRFSTEKFSFESKKIRQIKKLFAWKQKKAEDKQRKIEDESRGIKTDLHKEEQYIDATAETEEWKP